MEELRVCAFFDVLGTREIMIGSDTTRRHALISLIRKLEERTTNYSAGAQNLGLGVVFSPSAQTTTFSDNVAVSFPLERMSLNGTIGNKHHTFYIETSQFFDHLLIKIISAVWDGLKIGVLFRGGVSVGRLVHDDKIIAGEALVKAVERVVTQSSCRRLWFITTNDNLNALRFYQKRGFELVSVHRNALEKSRKLKPVIPLIGIDSIPLRDEIELEKIIHTNA